MDRKYFLQLDEHLKSEIENGIKLGENDIFGPIMQQISFRSCLILGMRSVAYRNQLFEPHRDERIEYFDGIEAILGIFYSEFPKIPFEEKIKAFKDLSFTPKSSKERFEAMKKVKELIPKLKTSWIEKC
jgi:hypothetical protein